MLRDVAVVDVAAGRIVPRQTVIVEDRTIRAVGPLRKLRIPRGARVIDGRGRYALPGLWDMGSFILDGLANAPGGLELMIAHGVVGTRDLNTAMPPAQVRTLVDAIDRGERPGPKLIWTTRAFSRARSTAPLAAAANRVDIPDDAAAIAAVEAAANEGAHYVRAVQHLPQQRLPATIAAARRYKLPVTGAFVHGYKPAIEAGVSGIEHFVDLYRSTPRKPERDDYLKLYRDDAFWALKAGTRDSAYAFFTPFRRLRDERYYRETIATLARAQTPITTNMATMMWAQQRIGAQIDERRKYARPEAAPPPPPPSAVDDRSRDGLWADLRDLSGAGVLLMAGTTAEGSPRALPGATLHDELEILVAAGFTPREAVATATVTPAKVIARLFPRVRAARAVAQDEPADILLLDADPLADVANVRRIHGVIANGRWFGPSERAALLDRAVQLAGNVP